MLIFWRTVFAVALLVTGYLCLTPKLHPPPELARHDKLVHFAVFAVNGLLALPAFRVGRARWIALAGLVLYGAALEWLQGFVPNRFSSLADGVANSLGILSAAMVGVWDSRRRGR